MPYCTQQDIEQRIGIAQLRQLTNDTWDVTPSTLSVAAHAGGSLTGTSYYVITSLCEKGETILSNEITYIVAGSNATARLSWTAVSTATSYKIYKSSVSGTYTSPCLLVQTNALTYDDTGAISTLLVGAPPANASIPDATIVSTIITQSDREIDGKAGQVWTVPFLVPDNCVSIPSIIKQISIVFSVYYCFLRRFSETDVPKQWIELYKKMCDNLESVSNQELQLDGAPSISSSEADIIAPDKQLDFADPNSPLNIY